MAVATKMGGRRGDRVITVSNAPLATRPAGHPVGEMVITYARGAKGVQIRCEAPAAEVGECEGGDSAAKRVAGDDDLVFTVGATSDADSSGGGVRYFFPGLRKTGVHLAFVDKVAVLPDEENVGDEVADVVVAAEDEDDFAAGMVESDVTTDAGPGSTEGFSCNQRIPRLDKLTGRRQRSLLCHS